MAVFNVVQIQLRYNEDLGTNDKNPGAQGFETCVVQTNAYKKFKLEDRDCATRCSPPVRQSMERGYTDNAPMVDFFGLATRPGLANKRVSQTANDSFRRSREVYLKKKERVGWLVIHHDNFLQSEPLGSGSMCRNFYVAKIIHDIVQTMT